MGLNITQGFNLNSPKPIDERYGVFSSGVLAPYTSIGAANLSYPSSYRKGKTVWVLKSGVGVEYWWRDGVLDIDLIEKSNTTVDTILTDGSINAISNNAVFDAFALRPAATLGVYPSSSLPSVNFDSAHFLNDGISSAININPAIALIRTNNQDLEITDATKGIILKTPGGARVRITINNDLSITTTSLTV